MLDIYHELVGRFDFGIPGNDKTFRNGVTGIADMLYSKFTEIAAMVETKSDGDDDSSDPS